MHVSWPFVRTTVVQALIKCIIHAASRCQPHNTRVKFELTHRSEPVTLSALDLSWPFVRTTIVQALIKCMIHAASQPQPHNTRVKFELTHRFEPVTLSALDLWCVLQEGHDADMCPRLQASNQPGSSPWNNLTPELIQRILGKMPARDSWSSRQISKRWANVVRATCDFTVVIPVRPGSIASTLLTLKQRRFLYPHLDIRVRTGKSQCQNVNSCCRHLSSR